MGCIPSSPDHGDGAHNRDHQYDDFLTVTSFEDSNRSVADSCPYHPNPSTSGSSRISRKQASTGPGARQAEQQRRRHYADPPSIWAQLFQTMVIFVALYFLGLGMFKVLQEPVCDMKENILNSISRFSQYLKTLTNDLENVLKDIDFAWIVRKPADWWDSDKVNWEQIMQVEVGLTVATLGAFVSDLLFSSEKEQGNSILLMPTLIYSLVYFVISIHAQATKLLDPEILQSFNIALIGEKIFSQPEMVVMTFTHIFALDLALAFAMMKDFYSRVSSRRMPYRLLMAVIALGVAQGISTIPIYLILRATLFDGPLIHTPRSLATNQNSYKRELEYLLDPVPRGAGAVNGWIQSIPSPLNIPFLVFFVALGAVRFALMLVAYLLYVTFVCFPVSAIFFSLRRSWRLLQGKEIQGALYTPFATVDGKIFPPKAVLIVSAHLRLVSFKYRSNFLFNWTIGWWLRNFLEAFVMYEFTLPFKDDFSPYVAFLMEEFGPVFPMGQGLGFGSYKDVKALIENPDQRKAGLSLAWSVSTAQSDWSKNNLTSLPRTEIEKSIVAEGRELVGCWLKDVNERLKDPLVQKQLDGILPFANVDGTMVDRSLIATSFGSTLFHLLTDGDFTEHERKRYSKLLTNVFPFMSDWMNKVWFGGILELKGIEDYDLVRRAFLRYLEAPSLQRTLAMAEEKIWDAWSPPEVVRFLVYKFVIAGGAAPAFLLRDIVQKLYEDPDLVSQYQDNPKKRKKFILEMARLQRCVPLVNFSAYNFKLADGRSHVTIFNRRIAVPDGTSLHCSVQNANRDVSVFGEDAEVFNFHRDEFVLGKMLTFNGNHNDIVRAGAKGVYDTPPRRCPGYSNSMDIIEFLVDRYCPKVNMEEASVAPERFDEIRRKETWFMKFALKMGQVAYKENNKYHPHASEVKHPLDTNGRKIGSLMMHVAGDRHIPVYDEDIPVVESMKDKFTSRVLSMAPITDDEGEWQNISEAIVWRKQWFSSNFPPVNTDYSSFKDVTEMVSQLAFSGICCLHTQKLESLPKDSLAVQKCQDKRTVYVNDNTALGSYRVRRGYQRYGATAYFDAEYNLIGVYSCCDGEYHPCPSKLVAVMKSSESDQNLEKDEYAEWRHAMWAWRVSALALVTVSDHLVNVHMIAANSLVSASRTHLPINHPVRSFLKIFTYQTISINSKAYRTLFMRKGVINRSWAFEEDDLQELLYATKNSFKKNFKDYIPESMKDVSDYPANQDLVAFADAVTELVHDFLCVVYDSPGKTASEKRRLQRNMDNDKDLHAFLQGLAGALGLVQSQDLFAFDDVVNVLSSLICNVTGMHELVGQISDYFADPKICGTTIRLNKEMDSIQIYQLNCTLVSSTGLRMPRLMGNWDHLFVRNRFADKAMQVMQRFQEKLRKLSIVIDERNPKRRFRMEAFNPVHMESSVPVIIYLYRARWSRQRQFKN